MLSAIGAISLFRAVTAEHAPAEPPAARFRPPHYLVSILSRVSHVGQNFGAAATPLLLLLLLSQSPTEEHGRQVREPRETTGFGVSLLPFGGVHTFSLVYATAGVSIPSSPLVEDSPTSRTRRPPKERTVQEPQHRTSSGLSVEKTAEHGVSLPRPSSDAEKPEALATSAARPQLLVENSFLEAAAALVPAQDAARNEAARRRAKLEDVDAAREVLRGKGKDGAGVRGFAAGKSKVGSRREGVGEARRREQMPEGRERGSKAEAIATGHGGGGGKGEWRGNEGKRIPIWDTSLVPLSSYSRTASEEFISARNRRCSNLPPPLPRHRVLPALRSFENVHGQLTLFFNGFSRKGSVIAYDLLNELRTVSEAQMMMDVEFLVLDRVMEYYGTATHLRVVDTTVMHRLLDLKNLLPWKLPRLVSDIRKLALEYQPVLRQFLNRYEPIIEALVLVKVPAGVKPLRPFLAHVFGVPKEKLILASDLNDLRDLIPFKYIPEEFGNASGGKVRDGAENHMSWIIMLEEIAQKLGEDALSSPGKAMLKEFKKNRRKAKAATDRKKVDASSTGFSAHSRESVPAPPSPILEREALGAEDSGGITEDGTSEEDWEDVDMYEKNKIHLNRAAQQSTANSGPVKDEDENDDPEEPSDDEFDYIG